MKKVTITAYPYARQTAEFEIPENLDDHEEAEYIREHWKEIKFGKPELDYRGTDFDVYPCD